MGDRTYISMIQELTRETISQEETIDRLAKRIEELEAALNDVPSRIRQLSQFTDPKHHEKIHQLADVMEVFTTKERTDD